MIKRRKQEKPRPESETGDAGGAGPEPVSRRGVLQATLGAGLTLALAQPALGAKAKSAKKMRPQPGDIVVFRFGDQKGQAVTPGDVPEGAKLLEAVAMDPASKILRDGSRLNAFNLVRIDPAELEDQAQAFVVEDIIAYSSVCTHQGCDLTEWLPETSTFKCFCHFSEFDATRLGKPVHGPARRRLALLPLKLSEHGELMVAQGFQGKVGFKKK